VALYVIKSAVACHGKVLGLLCNLLLQVSCSAMPDVPHLGEYERIVTYSYE
jgi:hypothetical protein